MLKLFRYLRPFRVAIVFILILVFLQSLAELFLPTLMAEIVDVGIVNGDIRFIFQMGGLMLAIAALGAGCSILASYLSAKTASGFGKILREEVFTRVESFSLPAIDKFGTATLITRTTNDITQVQQVTVMMLRMMLSAPLLLIGGIMMAVFRDAVLSQIFIVVLPLLALIVLLMGRTVLPLFKAIQRKLDKLNLVLRENLTGIRVIRAFNRIDHAKKSYELANLDLTNTTVKVHRLMAGMMPMMMLIMNLTTVSIIWFGGLRIDQGNMQVGDMMAFIQYGMLILFSLLMVSMLFVMIPRAAVSAGRIKEILDTVTEIKDDNLKEDGYEGAKREEAKKVKAADEIEPSSKSEIKENLGKESRIGNSGKTDKIGKRKMEGRGETVTSTGRIEFEKVTFNYPGAEKAAVSNISFTAGPGEITAIIGGTGSGKSTLLKLLLRFYEPESGKIKIDGVDISELSLNTLRKKIGYVPQKAVLFTGTIAENIRFGKKEAADKEVQQAAEIAQAWEFIAGLEETFAFPIAQGGQNLSGGQKQRLAIARALIRKPQIYALDDSFSALDFKTDAKLRAALQGVIQETAVLIVTQRVSTVLNADKIIVLDQGFIVGSGRHEELLTNCQVYREIVASQLSGEEPA